MKLLKILGLVVLAILAIYLFIYLSFLNQIRSYAKFWEESNRNDQNFEFLYVALGDSTAQGIGASKPENGYVWQVAKRIEEKTGKRVKTINLSKSGATTDEVLNIQLPSMSAYQPDLVTVVIGGNDMGSPEGIKKYKQNITEIAQKLPKGKSFISDSPYLHGRDSYLPSMESVGAVVEISKLYNAGHIKLYQATKDNHWNWGNYAWDYFHPNDLGYKVWTMAVWEAMVFGLEE